MRFSRVLVPCGYRPKVGIWGTKPVPAPQQMFSIWIPGKIIRRLGPLTYLVQIRAKRRYVQVDHLRLTAESDSYRSVSENTVPMIPNVLESVSVPSPVSDESVCQAVSVPQNTQKETDPSVGEQQGKTVVSATPLSTPMVIRRSGRRTKKRDILDL